MATEGVFLAYAPRPSFRFSLKCVRAQTAETCAARFTRMTATGGRAASDCTLIFTLSVNLLAVSTNLMPATAAHASDSWHGGVYIAARIVSPSTSCDGLTSIHIGASIQELRHTPNCLERSTEWHLSSFRSCSAKSPIALSASVWRACERTGDIPTATVCQHSFEFSPP